ncbi:MAG: Flp family type IVb pilin [Pseudonocardiales bacterium]
MLTQFYVRLLVAIKTKQDEGASAVEYALLVAAIAAVIVAVLFLFGSTIEGVFKTTCNSIKSSSGTTGC